MGSSETVAYARVRIAGQLECRSPLHMGDGTEQPFEQRQGCHDAPGRYRAVCLDSRGKPYIPATSLRGYLRDRAGDPGLADWLFGQVGPQGGIAGKVRIFDAPLTDDPRRGADDRKRPYWDPARATAIQHGTALEPITGTVDKHKLFRHEIVPEGARFSLELAADDLEPGSLALLLGLLASLDGESGSSLGRGTSRMQGRLQWTLARVDTLDERALLAWLDRDDLALVDAFEPLKSVPAPLLPSARPGYRVQLRLRPQGPLLIHEPGLVSRKPKRDEQPQDEAEERHDPDLEFSRTPDERALIPASSLRGLLRGRARRILVTLAAASDPAGDPAKAAESLLGQLFGTTGQRGRLWTSDAVAERPCDSVDQTFVAIDRFTGGGERHKLYRANAARCDTLRAEIRLDARQCDLADWEKGLLLLLARDALEGELAAGWGKARGYGALDVELKHADAWIDTWTDPHGRGLLQRIDADPGRAIAQGWIDALHREIGSACAAHRPQPQTQPTRNPR